MNKHGFELLLGRVFLFILVTAVAFSVIDSLSPFFLKKLQSPIESAWDSPHLRDPKAYVIYGGEPLYRDLNALGYTGKLPEKVKKPGEYRIFVLGSSTVFGQITQPLEELFRKSGHSNVSVFNCGVVSSVSSMEVARIVFEIIDLEPDLIIMYNGGNDVLDPYWERSRPGDPFNFILYENNPLLKENLERYNSFTLLLFRSNIFRYLFHGYFLRQFFDRSSYENELPWMSEGWKTEIVNIYTRNIIKAHKISRAFNAEFMAFFQPTAYFKDKPANDTERYYGGFSGAFSDIRAYAREMRQRIVIGGRGTFDKEKVDFTDFSENFNDENVPYFVDYIHVTNAANEITTKKMYEHIIGSITVFADDHSK
jgi:hypothetical protein